MKCTGEVSIHRLIENIKHGCQVLFVSKGVWSQYPFQSLLTGTVGLGIGLAGLCWLLGGASNQKESSYKSMVTVAGLRNLGNNCFLNCILQSLASSRCLLPFLQNMLIVDDVGDEQSAETLPLVVSLISLLEELGAVRDEKTIVNPRSVMHAMTQYNEGFNLTRQQDAAEAFIHLLSSLKEEITEHYNRLLHGRSLADIFAKSSRIYNQEKGVPNEVEKWKKLSIDPFDGVIGSYLRCQTCSAMLSVDLEFFHSLPLSPVLGRHADIKKGCSLFDCLELFTKVECVDNFRCGRCWHLAALNNLSYRPEMDEVKIKELKDCVKLDSCDCKNLFLNDEFSWIGISHALKKLSIIKCPKVLSFHLQRASMNWNGELIKLHGHISFPLFLDLSPFVESATKMGHLTSVKHSQNSVKVQQDGTFVPHIDLFLKQWNRKNLPPHLYRIAKNQLLEYKLAESAAGDNCGKLQAFPERDDSNKIEIINSESADSCMYCLCSVVEHYGKPGSGHYAVYRKIASKLSSNAPEEPQDPMIESWVYISDSKVECVREEDVLAVEASILFYEKVKTDHQ